jgi:hypothetical protein
MYMDLAAFLQNAPTPVPLSSMSFGMGKDQGALTMRMSIGM